MDTVDQYMNHELKAIRDRVRELEQEVTAYSIKIEEKDAYIKHLHERLTAQNVIHIPIQGVINPKW